MIEEYHLYFRYIKEYETLVLLQIRVTCQEEWVDRVHKLGYGDMMKWFTEE